MLKGKVAIITGAAAGIGYHIAKHFVANGAAAVIADINEEGAKNTAEEFINMGGRAIGLLANVANVGDCKRIVNTALAEFGRVDTLVNNAGLPSQYDAGSDLESWDLGIEQTLSSVHRMSQAALTPLLESKGSIINICSVSGNTNGGNTPWYCAAKAGVRGLTMQQALTYGPKGLRSNSLCLGFINTARTQFLKDKPELGKGLSARVPLKRMGEPEEVAPAALFLASDGASYVNGQMLIVDGGLSIA
jgi:NAD(P)-dependent dehydrogenase (short-subunit alcohol dehydrogenase family)